jgi:hypothetical protein
MMGELADEIVGDLVDSAPCELCGQTAGFCFCDPDEEQWAWEQVE